MYWSNNDLQVNAGYTYQRRKKRKTGSIWLHNIPVYIYLYSNIFLCLVLRRIYFHLAFRERESSEQELSSSLSSVRACGACNTMAMCLSGGGGVPVHQVKRGPWLYGVRTFGRTHTHTLYSHTFIRFVCLFVDCAVGARGPCAPLADYIGTRACISVYIYKIYMRSPSTSCGAIYRIVHILHHIIFLRCVRWTTLFATLYSNRSKCTSEYISCI